MASVTRVLTVAFTFTLFNTVDAAKTVWTHRLGAIGAGGNVPGTTPLNVTVKEAEDFCASHATCVGFTFQSPDAVPAGPVRTYFKTGSAGNSDPGWQTYTRHMPWEQVLQKVQMDDAAEQQGAVCLDGSPGVFYWAPAWDSKLASTWVIFFEGGGWCYSEADCVGRSHGPLGSSKTYPPNMTQSGYSAGIFGPDPHLNPDFAGANHVYLRYCDGNSFAGDRTQPLAGPQGQKLFFRGRRILDAALDTLAGPQYGLASATDVLVTGCSAGGLATYLHADYVAGQLGKIAPGLTRVKAASVSGFFLDHPNAEGIPVYQEQMREIFALSNASGSVNQACVAAQAAGEEWKCNMAQYTYPHVSTPLMVLNSALDTWQISCILGAERSSVGGSNCSATPAIANEGCCCTCYGSLIESCCDAAAFALFQQYEATFRAILASSPTYSKPGNAAFAYSCYTHCAMSQDLYHSVKIGNTTAQHAVSEWWNSATSAAAVNYAPCTWQGPDKEDCNPTCPRELKPSLEAPEAYPAFMAASEAASRGHGGGLTRHLPPRRRRHSDLPWDNRILEQ